MAEILGTAAEVAFWAFCAVVLAYVFLDWPDRRHRP